MKKKISIALFISILSLLSLQCFAAPITHIVRPGDTLWRIAVRYEIGLSEIIAKNPQFKNPDLIYPGDKVTVPNIDDVKSLESRVADLVNRERASAGLSPLKINWELSRVARYKSMDMASRRYFSHDSPTYGSPFDMMRNFGIRYSRAGENIAMGQRTPEEVMNAWMNSPGHRRNILSNDFAEIGVGLAENNVGTKYWTQMFIRR